MKYFPTTEAEIIWQAGQPRSRKYNDHYFNTDGGLEETRYVFIQQNGLPARWHDAARFVIAETGFGTGLNFLATSQCWLATTQPTQKLTYISVEKHPLNKTDLRQALNLWPELAFLAQDFIAQYPPNIPGFHYLNLFDGRISLILLLGDACEMYRQLQAQVDVWYLDGFAPKQNAAMWSHALFKEIARLSRVGCRVTTYTAAGDVRRGLEIAGFALKKRTGFGVKREMLVGEMREKAQSSLAKPWFDFSRINKAEKKEVAIIGAGIVGLTTAYVLANSGWNVCVYEKQSKIAGGASGNPVGLVMPRFTADMNCGAQFYTQCFLTTVAWLNHLQHKRGFNHWHSCGVLHLMPEEKLGKLRCLNLPEALLTELTAHEIKTKYRFGAKYGGYFVHQAGYIEPVMLCQFLFDALLESVKFNFSTEVTALKKMDNGWDIISQSEVLQNSKNVVIANANDAVQLLPQVELPLIPVRGQVSQLSPDAFNHALSFPLVCENYLTPVVEGYATLGASYERDHLALGLREEEHQATYSQMESVIPGLLNPRCFARGRASLRSTTHDRFPVVGPVPNISYFQKVYADIKHGKPPRDFPAAEYQTGLFLNTGHGSRGLVSAYNAAELLRVIMEQQPLMFSNDILASLHPARFLVKKMKRA